MPCGIEDIILEDIFLYEEIGELARYALRLSKAGVIGEEDWQAFICQVEEKTNNRKYNRSFCQRVTIVECKFSTP